MFGRKKMYKKGLADAMQAYEAFGKKQEAAIAHMREEIRKGQKLEEALNDTIASLGDDIAGLYDYLNAQEKKALYHLSTPLDIKDLDKEEQQYLLAILYQLASDEGDLLTDYQRMFIRSVQRYLEITNPQTEADLSAVGDIDSLEVQKAFLQTVLEFFYLQDGDELTDTQEEFLGYFSVNKRQALLIEERVSRLFNVVKAEGIAEKYGFVPDEEDIKNVNNPGISEKANDSRAFTTEQEKYIDDFVRGIRACDDIIETKSYLLGINWNDIWVRMDKITGEKRAYREDEVGLYGHYLSPAVIDDILYLLQFGSLVAFDVSTMSSKIIAPSNNIGGISACANKVVFVDDNRPYFYDIDKEKRLTIPSIYGCTSVFADQAGFYFTSPEDEYNPMHNYHKIQYYDYTSKEITTVCRKQEDIQILRYCKMPNIFYVSCASYLHKPLKRVGPPEKNYDVMNYSNDTKVHAYHDCLVFIAPGGEITKLNYETGETTVLSDDASTHHHLDGGLFKKSESWDTPIDFCRIGNCIFYNPKGDYDRICKIPLFKPDEKEMFPCMNIQEFQQSILFRN